MYIAIPCYFWANFAEVWIACNFFQKNDSLIEVCFNLTSVHNVLYTMGHRWWPGINLLVCAVLSSPTLITVTARYCSAKYAFLALVCWNKSENQTLELSMHFLSTIKHSKEKYQLLNSDHVVCCCKELTLKREDEDILYCMWELGNQGFGVRLQKV